MPCPDGLVVDQCALVRVPLDHARPQGQQIEVFVAVKEALSTLNQPDPVVYLTGGPGSSSADMVKWFANYLISDRDVIGVDYRGTRYSKPTFDCPSRVGAEFEKCVTQWRKQGLELQYFNSVQAAQDIEFVRRALKVGKINLYGASYGTLLAQEYMRHYPGNLRSVILSGVLPAESDPSELTPGIEHATRQLLKACADSPNCEKNYPDLLKRFEQQFPALPLETRQELVHRIALAGGSTWGVRKVPEFIEDALNGKPFVTDPASLAPPSRASNGVNMVVNCQESPELMSLREMEKAEAKATLFKGAIDNTPYLKACQTLNLKRVSDTFYQPVRPTIPVLLLNGSFDMRTPPLTVLNHFNPLPAQWQRVVVGGAAHDAEWTPCGLRLMQDFLREPTQPLEQSCAAQQKINFP